MELICVGSGTLVANGLNGDPCASVVLTVRNKITEDIRSDVHKRAMAMFGVGPGSVRSCIQQLGALPPLVVLTSPQLASLSELQVYLQFEASYHRKVKVYAPGDILDRAILLLDEDVVPDIRDYVEFLQVEAGVPTSLEANYYMIAERCGSAAAAGPLDAQQQQQQQQDSATASQSYNLVVHNESHRAVLAFCEGPIAGEIQLQRQDQTTGNSDSGIFADCRLSVVNISKKLLLEQFTRKFSRGTKFLVVGYSSDRPPGLQGVDRDYTVQFLRPGDAVGVESGGESASNAAAAAGEATPPREANHHHSYPSPHEQQEPRIPLGGFGSPGEPGWIAASRPSRKQDQQQQRQQQQQQGGSGYNFSDPRYSATSPSQINNVYAPSPRNPVSRVRFNARMGMEHDEQQQQQQQRQQQGPPPLRSTTPSGRSTPRGGGGNAPSHNAQGAWSNFYHGAGSGRTGGAAPSVLGKHVYHAKGTIFASSARIPKKLYVFTNENRDAPPSVVMVAPKMNLQALKAKIGEVLGLKPMGNIFTLDRGLIRHTDELMHGVEVVATRHAGVPFSVDNLPLKMSGYVPPRVDYGGIGLEEEDETNNNNNNNFDNANDNVYAPQQSQRDEFEDLMRQEAAASGRAGGSRPNAFRD